MVLEHSARKGDWSQVVTLHRFPSRLTSWCHPERSLVVKRRTAGARAGGVVSDPQRLVLPVMNHNDQVTPSQRGRSVGKHFASRHRDARRSELPYRQRHRRLARRQQWPILGRRQVHDDLLGGVVERDPPALRLGRG